MEISKDILRFWHLMEIPMLIHRSSKLSSGREYSDAEHSWRLAMLVIFLGPKLGSKINIERALRIALIHDLGEMGGGDVPFYIHAFDANAKADKDKQEEETMQALKSEFSEFGEELFLIWKEYEDQSTIEARFVKALDKLDGRIGIIDDKETQNFSEERRKKATILSKKVDEFCEIDPLLKEIAALSLRERQDKWGF